MTATIILGSRPGKKSKDAIRAWGVTHILTLLSPRERPDGIAKIARGIGAEWHHCPVDGGHADTLAKIDLSRLFLHYDEIVRHSGEDGDDAVIYLHCSAGIHRTGFVVYALLRYRGLSPEAAREEVAKLRPVTSEGVGEDSLVLAEDMFCAWQAG